MKKRRKSHKSVTMEQRVFAALMREGMTATALCKKAGIAPRERNRFYGELQRLAGQGRIRRIPSEDGGPVLFATAGRLVAGQTEEFEAEIVSVHERFGFARRLDTGEEYFLPGHCVHASLPGDRVWMRGGPGRRGGVEGEVLRVLDAAMPSFTGVIEAEAGESYLLPDGPLRRRLRIDEAQLGGACDGDRVAARLSQRGIHHREHRAEVLAVTGGAQDARACADALVIASGVPVDFSPAALEQARRLGEAGVPPEACAGRLDLREETVFTIDGPYAKDLDDAVSIERLASGWRLGVHIADVSHYVTARSALDEEAYERGTSIYFADRVIPMLPPELSNGVCSLGAGEDRLTLSALLTLDENAELLDYSFHKAVIRSKVCGVYGEVNDLLDGTASEAVQKKYAPVAEALRELDALAHRRRERRAARGAVDLEITESELCFDETGAVCGIRPRTGGRAESLIEECMILCNCAAAALGVERGIPFLYRVHDEPSPERLDELFALLARLGVEARRGETVPPAALRAILERARGSGVWPVVNTQILRSMAKARYSEQNTGHYGLALRRYSHFTSPIRRYPDLAVHRILSDVLAGAADDAVQSRYGAFAPAAAKQSSSREVRAMTLERDCQRYFVAQYMSAQVGKSFDGVISSVTSYGLYVLLPNSVEGLVRLDQLGGDDYELDGSLALRGRHTGRRFQIGDALRVVVARAAVSSGQIDFVPEKTR